MVLKREWHIYQQIQWKWWYFGYFHINKMVHLLLRMRVARYMFAQSFSWAQRRFLPGDGTTTAPRLILVYRGGISLICH